MMYVALATAMLLPLAASFAYMWVSFTPEDLSESNEPSYWDEIQEHIDLMKERLDGYSIERDRSSDVVYGSIADSSDACTRGR